MTTIDFLPERIKLQRARRRRLVRLGYLLAVAAGAVVAWGYFGRQRIERAQAELDRLRHRSANLQCRLAQKHTLHRQLADLLIKQRISKTLGSRASVLDMTYELERLLPPSMFLQDVTLETIDLALPPAGRVRSAVAARAAPPEPGQGASKRVRLRLTGLAPSDVAVANFIGQLSASPMFEHVNMGYTRNTVYQGRAAKQFQASCHVAR
jgi:Tfp pilus assembly protein PilN